MKRLIFLCLCLVAVGCTTDPVPVAVSPDLTSSNDQTKDTDKDTSQTDQPNDMKMGSGSKKITVYRWILRDKDNKVVDAMAFPAWAHTSQAPVVAPPNVAENVHRVLIESLNGQRIGGQYNLATGQPDSGNCYFQYANDQCTEKVMQAHTAHRACKSKEDGKHYSAWGSPRISPGAKLYRKSTTDGSCKEQVSSTSYYEVKDLPDYKAMLLPDAPYTLSYEAE